MAALNHSSEIILPSEDTRLGVRSHSATQGRLHSGPNAPPRGDFIHHHGQIEVYFESRNMLRDSIHFLVHSHLTNQQAVEDSDKSPLDESNIFYYSILLLRDVMNKVV